MSFCLLQTKRMNKQMKQDIMKCFFDSGVPNDVRKNCQLYFKQVKQHDCYNAHTITIQFIEWVENLQVVAIFFIIMVLSH